jgi:hypothetical protein
MMFQTRVLGSAQTASAAREEVVHLRYAAWLAGGGRRTVARATTAHRDRPTVLSSKSTGASATQPMPSYRQPAATRGSKRRVRRSLRSAYFLNYRPREQRLCAYACRRSVTMLNVPSTLLLYIKCSLRGITVECVREQPLLALRACSSAPAVKHMLSTSLNTVPRWTMVSAGIERKRRWARRTCHSGRTPAAACRC